MSRETITINDKHSDKLKDRVSAISPYTPLKGRVEIFEKQKDGQLTKLREKHNLIVYGGRNWLLYKAFGSVMTAQEPDLASLNICWFGAGEGGGEPGNPLQAGATMGQDTTLLSQVQLRKDMDPQDVGYDLYASNIQGDHGYYKKFSSVVIKEDVSNPYIDTDQNTKYPPIIAEVRVELTSDDACSQGEGGEYTDLNEAALFIADPNVADPGSNYVNTDPTIGSLDVSAVTKDGDYCIYKFGTGDLEQFTRLNLGDSVYVTRTSGIQNTILESSPALIVDIYNDPSHLNSYIVVEKPNCVDETLGAGEMTAHFVDKTIMPYIMFSRVTFSTVRKSSDREIVFLWRLYF